jgi:hypothetical protein
MGEILLVDNVLDRDMVIVLLHKFLGRGETLARAAGNNSLGCHCQSGPFELTKG